MRNCLTNPWPSEGRAGSWADCRPSEGRTRGRGNDDLIHLHLVSEMVEAPHLFEFYRRRHLTQRPALPVNDRLAQVPVEWKAARPASHQRPGKNRTGGARRDGNQWKVLLVALKECLPPKTEPQVSQLGGRRRRVEEAGGVKVSVPPLDTGELRIERRDLPKGGP